jgi:hypothetical protein
MLSACPIFSLLLACPRPDGDTDYEVAGSVVGIREADRATLLDEVEARVPHLVGRLSWNLSGSAGAAPARIPEAADYLAACAVDCDGRDVVAADRRAA